MKNFDNKKFLNYSNYRLNNYKNIMLVILLSIALFVGSFSSNALASAGEIPISQIAENLTQVPDGYIGVYNSTDLDAVRNNPSAKYIMMNDIDLLSDTSADGLFYNNGLGWIPIAANKAGSFNGVFDGNGYTVKGMQININYENKDYNIGLFGYNSGTIENLNITDSIFTLTSNYELSYKTVHGQTNVGGVAGYNDGEINKCFTDNTFNITTGPIPTQYISDPWVIVGGIAGYNKRETVGINKNGVIQNSSNMGNINMNDAYTVSGGIAGWNYEGLISSCYNTGEIRGKCSGGIAGKNEDANLNDYFAGEILNCYNTGYIKGQKAGSITGYNDQYSTIGFCYNIGKSSGIPDYMQRDNVESFYSLADIKDNSLRSSLTLEEMKLESSFVGYDFETVWEIGANLEYPFPTLKLNKHIINTRENFTDYAGGAGNDINPFKISTKEQLKNVNKYLSASFILVNSIEFSKADFEINGDFYNNGAGWNPLCNNLSNCFRGIFNGNGFYISGLSIYSIKTETAYIGLFGYNAGTIKNLGIVDITFINYGSSTVYMGGIAGMNRNGRIINSYCSGSIKSVYENKFAQIGGISGGNEYGNIENCFNKSAITDKTYSSYCGGITGSTNDGTIYNCYNIGTVEGNFAGGIAGSNNANTIINNCYNTGKIIGATGGKGGIIGFYREINNTVINNCYFLNNCLEGVGNVNGYATRLSMTQMKQQGSYVNFDFDKIWNMSTNYLPYLKEMPYVELNSIKFNPSTIRFGVNYFCTTTILYEPANVTFTDCVYTSLDNTVAVVDSYGVVRGLSIGTTDINVKDNISNNTATVKVEVLEGASWITISGDKEIYPGEQSQLSARTLPNNTINSNILWTSSDNTTASVDRNGLVTAKKGGYVTIYAASTNIFNLKSEFQMTIIRNAESVSLNTTQMELSIGAKIKLVATIAPSDTTVKTITWSSNNNNIASVDSTGQVTCLSSGVAYISATTLDGGHTSTCRVTVYQGATSIKLSTKLLYIGIGCIQNLYVVVTPSNATNYHYSLNYSGSCMLVIGNGQILGLTAGNALVKLYSSNGQFIESCSIIVGKPVTQINLNTNQIALQEGQTKQLIVTQISPYDAVTKTLSWYSYDSSIASVSANGLVTAKGIGSTTIYAKATDGSGIFSSCTVTVNYFGTVLFNSMGGSYVDAVNVKSSVLITPPMNPTKPGYNFVGWYNEALCINEWNFATEKVQGDTILYAKWNAILYSVIFNSMGGSIVASKSVAENTIFTAPANPTRTGYIFAGWFTSTSYTTPWVFATNKVTANTTLYAKWIVSQVTGLIVAPVNYNSLKISWTATPGANYYEVYRASSLGGTYYILTTQSATLSTTYTTTGLGTGTTYYFKVRAYSLNGTTKIYNNYSAIVSNKPLPSAPTGLVSSAASYSSTKLSWATVAGANGYSVYRATTLTGSYSLIATVTTNTYTKTALTTGATYYYKVNAYRLVGTTKVYGSQCAAIGAKVVPSTPTSLGLSSPSYNSLKLTWAGVYGASGYSVYRSTSPTGTYTLLATVTTNSYSNINLVPGTSYFYKVNAYRLVGTTKVYGSQCAAVGRKAVPATITTLTAVRYSATSIKLNWGAISGASGYEIYRSTSATGTYTLLTTLTAISYINTSLVTGTTYYYKVRAYRLVGTTKVYADFSAVKYAKP